MWSALGADPEKIDSGITCMQSAAWGSDTSQLNIIMDELGSELNKAKAKLAEANVIVDGSCKLHTKKLS